MTNHYKVYCKSFGFSHGEFINCEICKAPAVDIHHLIPRSKFGGKSNPDTPENLMALCRECHTLAHNEIYDKVFLKEVHAKMF